MKTVLIGVMMICAACFVQAELVIDNFDYVLQELGPIGSSSNIEESAIAPAGNTIGDYRYLLLIHESGANNVDAAVDAAADPNALRYETESLTRGTLFIDWDNFTNENFETAGDRLEIDISSHGGSLTYTFEAFTDGTGSSTYSRQYSLGTPGTLSFDFTNFTGTADFTDIDRLTLEISNRDAGFGTPDADTTIDQIGVIPEPTSLGLLLMGVLTTRIYRRKFGRFISDLLGKNLG